MKKLILFWIFSSFYTQTAQALTHDLEGYMRSGVGTNTKGGDQVCFSNPGAAGNEFRLGNECSTYGEIAWRLHHMTSKGVNSPYFKSQIRFAFSPKGHTNWESANGTSASPSPMAVRESYFEGGRFGGTPYTYWAGKRFYRENDLHMNDWYYFGDMSSNGAGMGQIPFLGGKLQLAWLREVSSTTSDIGNHGVTVYDARLKEIQITDKNKGFLWLGYATAPGGTDTSNSKVYESSNGYLAGFFLETGLKKGFNHFAIMYGKGLLDDFNVYGSSALEAGSTAHKTQEDSSKIRLVEHMTYDLNSKLSFHASTSVELRDNGAANDNRSTWWNVGIQPMYFFSDHHQLVGVLGTSLVDADGSQAKRLTRFTIAPQISAGRNIWARPVIRLFYTRSWWSTSNRGSVGGTTYSSETSGGSYGVQGEVWF
ncbi:MAG: carbohydrate porin [Bacteriovoracaceae bacterium]|nr:carbohydrate porin [Bacteriovoracaceae bacterium]